MKIHHLFAATLVLVTAIPTAAQEKGAKRSDEKCSVVISFPGVGSKVAENGDARGTAKGLPVGSRLWILAHRMGLALWWPQGGGEVSVPAAGEWLATVTYGTERDQGSKFEVAAIVVDEPTHASLTKWIAQAEATGRYPGMSMPKTVDACSVSRVIVTR